VHFKTAIKSGSEGSQYQSVLTSIKTENRVSRRNQHPSSCYSWIQYYHYYERI